MPLSELIVYNTLSKTGYLLAHCAAVGLGECKAVNNGKRTNQSNR